MGLSESQKRSIIRWKAGRRSSVAVAALNMQVARNAATQRCRKPCYGVTRRAAAQKRNDLTQFSAAKDRSAPCTLRNRATVEKPIQSLSRIRRYRKSMIHCALGERAGC